MEDSGDPPPAWAEGFSATVDYPPSLPNSMFDLPSGETTFSYESSKRGLKQLLAGTLGRALLENQEVSLKAVLYDGLEVYVIWQGCPADFQDVNRFRINGTVVGEEKDVRCLSSARCLRKPSAHCPFCAEGESSSKYISGNVDLTLPVFAPDASRPFKNQEGKVVGFHSRYLGDVSFHNVPVTPCGNIDLYEREFGLLNSFW